MIFLRFALFAVLIFGLCARAWLQQDVLFYDWDEGIYAEVSSELVERGGIQTTFNGDVWFNKPPLSHALIASAFRLGADPELSARMIMVIAASLVLIGLYVLTRRTMQHFFARELADMHEIERELVGFIPIAALVTTPVFMDRTTQLNTDVMLAACWIGYFLSMQSYPLRLLAITLGSLAKSLLGLYPLAFEVLRIRNMSLAPQTVMKGLALVIVPLLWHIINYVVYGQYFVKSHLMDQLLKRVTDPIELHYGGKLYYVFLAWENFSILYIVMIIGFALIAYDALRKHGSIMQVWRSKDWEWYLILGSAVPFYLFLSIVQSKISWYFATVAPLLTISLPYVYMRMRMTMLRYVLLAGLLIYAVVQFVPATFAYRPTGDNRTELVSVAECIAQHNGESVAVLVNAQERQNRNVLEAAGQQTETSFIYGGTPAFVYYSEKDVEYFYDVDSFWESYAAYPLIVVSADDMTDDVAELNEWSQLDECAAGEWRIFQQQ